MNKVDQMFNIMTFRAPNADRDQGAKYFAALAGTLGIKIVTAPNNKKKYPYGWDGQTIRIESETRFIEDMAHELSHFICANPSRRFEIEFGLGNGFSTVDYEKADKVSKSLGLDNSVRIIEENITCLMAAILLKDSGQDCIEESELVNFVSGSLGFDDSVDEWIVGSTESLEEYKNRIDYYIGLLIRWGVVDQNLQFTGKIRQETRDYDDFV